MLDEPPAKAASVHKRRHGRHPIATCWKCERELARCRSKVTFETREAVDATVDEINEAEHYAEPVMRYPCAWGPHWHVAHARFRFDRKRARRAERRWRARLATDCES